MESIMVFRMRTPSARGAMNLIVFIIILLLLSCGCRNCFATSPAVDGCQNSTNPTLVGVMSHIIGVWNSSKYGASSFRDDVAKIYFQVWPEDMQFQYFCEDGRANLSLANFTYSCTEGQLDPRPYYDVGTADNHQPYYKNWYYWRTPVKQLSYPIRCEYNDIRRLYVHRFWQETMAPAAKAWATIVATLEVAAVAFSYLSFAASLHIQKWRSDGSNPNESVQKHSFHIFQRVGRIDTIADCIHIFLLIAVGYGMVEVVGHSDLHSWRVSCFYNIGVIYTYLTLLAVASSLFRQLATSATACSNDRNRMGIRNSVLSELLEEAGKLYKHTTEEATTAEQDKGLHDQLAQNVKTLCKKFVDQESWDPLEKTPNDWRWQRVFGQFAVLILLGIFLCFVDSDTGTALENLAGILLAAVVAASIWSGGVSAVLLVHSVCHIGCRIHKRTNTKANRSSSNNKQAKEQMRVLGRINQYIPKLLNHLQATKQRIAEFFLKFGGRSGTPARTSDLSNRRRSQKKNARVGIEEWSSTVRIEV